MMFDKAKEFFTKLFRKIRYKIIGTKLYKLIFDKQKDSKKMKRFLKKVANGKYTVKGNVGQTYPDLDDDLFIVELAIKNEYVRGMKLDYEDILPELDIMYPSVTILGETFLRNQSFHNKHPVWTSIFIAFITSFLTLLISNFFK
ncbi:hypothetical protein ACFC3A_04610 [Enterococcus thailandicus]|uniref:hypothetical protein n=1 Tax=Enterococcus thailandicus TaxID=417368 RepID=UPI0039A45583